MCLCCFAKSVCVCVCAPLGALEGCIVCKICTSGCWLAIMGLKVRIDVLVVLFFFLFDKTGHIRASRANKWANEVSQDKIQDKAH